MLPVTERVKGLDHPDTMNIRAHVVYWAEQTADTARDVT
jgi:hypothetical protein